MSVFTEEWIISPIHLIRKVQQRIITGIINEQNFQMGGTAFYGFRWKDKNTSNLTISYSSLQTDRDHEEVIERTSGNQGSTTSIHESSFAIINEVNSRIDNTFNLTERHIADAGLGLLYYFTYNGRSTDTGYYSG